jgi:alpha-glucosidase
LTKVPTVWDETCGVLGEINKFAVVARRKGDKWWLGAITNWDEREMEIPTAFLGSGNWEVEAFEDAEDSNVDAENFVCRKYKIKAGDKIKVRLARGGGFAACFSRAP